MLTTFCTALFIEGNGAKARRNYETIRWLKPTAMDISSAGAVTFGFYMIYSCYSNKVKTVILFFKLFVFKLLQNKRSYIMVVFLPAYFSTTIYPLPSLLSDGHRFFCSRLATLVSQKNGAKARRNYEAIRWLKPTAMDNFTQIGCINFLCIFLFAEIHCRRF